MTGENANASANIGTEVTIPYKIKHDMFPNQPSTLKVIILDYPHFDGINLANKLQFLFSRYLLDHTFMVCTAMDRMDGDDTKVILNLLQSGDNVNYHVVVNRCDDLWNDCKNDLNKAKEVYDKLKEEIMSQHIKTTDPEKVLLTCIAKHKLNFDEQDGLYRSKILLKDEFQHRIFEILCKILKIEPIAATPLSLFTEYKAKEIFIQNEKGNKTFHVILTNNKNRYILENGTNAEIVDSYKELMKEVKFFGIINPQFRPKFDSIIINDFEQFFSLRDKSYIVFKKD